jgi:hypothetical protein
VSLDRRAALAATATAAGALVLAAPAPARSSADKQVLERLLALEIRLRSAYETAARRRVVDVALANLIAGHEGDHAEGLGRVVKRRSGGGAVATVPEPELNRALAGGRKAFLRFALRSESDVVAAYADAVTNLGDRTLLQPLGSVLASHAQHLVLLRKALGETDLTRAFEPGDRRSGSTQSG